MLNVGIIGMGKMGILHTGILAALDDANVVAVAEKDSTLHNYLKNILHESNIKIYDDYNKMFKKEDLNLVYITTPVSLHFRMANDCIDNNINFFVEKPLVSNMEECKNLYTKLVGKETLHFIGYSKRFVDTFVKAKEILESNVLGDILHFKGSMYLTQVFTKGKGWRFKRAESGGGVLLELASHLIDLLLWYLGNVDSVVSTVKNYYSTEVEDFVHAILRLENGLTGYIDTSWSVRNYRLPEINIEIHGSNGTLFVNEDYIRLTLDNRSDKLDMNAGITTLYKQDLFKGVPIDIGGIEYTKEDMHVIQHVKDNKQSMLNVFEGSKVQAVIDAIYNSAKNNSWIKVKYVA